MAQSFYQSHVFFCTNIRDESSPRPCCGRQNAAAVFAYAKDKIKALGLNKPEGVRINKAGCFDRCEEGPLLVVYPDAVWYTYVDEADIDEIIEQHILQGKIVQRLLVENV